MTDRPDTNGQYQTLPLVEVIERINNFPGDGWVHEWALPRSRF